MSLKKEKKKSRAKNIKTGDYFVNPGVDIGGTRANNGRKTDYNNCLAENLGITNLTASQLFSMAGAKK